MNRILCIFALASFLGSSVPASGQDMPGLPINRHPAGESSLDPAMWSFEVGFTGDSLLATGVGEQNDRFTAGLLDLSLTAAISDRSQLHVLVQAVRSDLTLTDDLRAVQPVSNIQAIDLLQVSELWWERATRNGVWSLRIGKQDLNADVCATDGTDGFIHSSFGLIPTVPMPAYPDPGLGISVTWNALDVLTLRGAIADGAARGGTWGFDTLFDGDGGLFSVLESEVRTPAVSGRDGAIRAGVWYHSGEWMEIGSEEDPRTFDGAAGWYVSVCQALLAGPTPDTPRMSFLLQLGHSPEDRMEIPRHLGAGLVLSGFERLIEGAGIGFSRVEVLADNGAWSRETAIELYTRLRVTERLTLQPDFQYIINPGADGSDNVLVAGIRVGWQFDAALSPFLR